MFAFPKASIDHSFGYQAISTSASLRAHLEKLEGEVLDATMTERVIAAMSHCVAAVEMAGRHMDFLVTEIENKAELGQQIVDQVEELLAFVPNHVLLPLPFSAGIACMDDWCREHCKGGYRIFMITYRQIAVFDQNSDATMFKMRWC